MKYIAEWVLINNVSLNQFELTTRWKNADTSEFMWRTCWDPIQIIQVKLNNDWADNFEAAGERISGKRLFSSKRLSLCVPTQKV